MFHYLHCYLPETWEAQVKAGLINKNAGFRICESIDLAEEKKFNRLAAKDGELYALARELRAPFYIDRLQGGCFIEDYPYDMALVESYQELLGDHFWGFQMHEWMSNYRNDLRKIKRNGCRAWTAAEIEKAIRREFDFPHLFLECMNLQEMTESGDVTNLTSFVAASEKLYAKRQAYTKGRLLSCDSAYLAYPIEMKYGTKRIMPEIGAQTPNTRIQVAYARGMAKAHHIPFGTYYEPWGGSPFSACCYQRDNQNEWNIGSASDFPFVTQGENGGSSRSLQWRMHLYSYMAGAAFMAEEWGMCNTFYDWKDFELSPYGIVKRDFIRFTEKYSDIGKPVTPVAVVLPKELPVLEVHVFEGEYLSYPVPDAFKPTLDAARNGLREIFTETGAMLGTETTNLLNHHLPDALDIVNADVLNADAYEYLVDLTGSTEFAQKHSDKIVPIHELENVLKKILPVTVDGAVHRLFTQRGDGRIFMLLMNNSGIVRSVQEGEHRMPEAQVCVMLDLKGKTGFQVHETDGKTEKLADGRYAVTLPAGGYFFASVG